LDAAFLLASMLVSELEWRSALAASLLAKVAVCASALLSVRKSAVAEALGTRCQSHAAAGAAFWVQKAFFAGAAAVDQRTAAPEWRPESDPDSATAENP
jgi:hypothetical protein